MCKLMKTVVLNVSSFKIKTQLILWNQNNNNIMQGNNKINYQQSHSHTCCTIRFIAAMEQNAQSVLLVQD